jgi:hypothetical protein
MSELIEPAVKRYRVDTLPGRIARDCPEVVLASDYDRLLERFMALKIWVNEVAEQGAKVKDL